MRRIHGESAKKPFRTRAIGIAGVMMAGMVGLAITGITTASAATSSGVDVPPTQENHNFVTRGHVDGTDPGSQTAANNLAASEAFSACRSAGFDSFIAGDADVIVEDGGITVVFHGYCVSGGPRS